MAELTGGFARGLFPRIAWTVVLGFIVLHIAGFYFYGHERLVENAKTFALGVAQRAVQIDELLASQPELLPLLQSPSFEIQRMASLPPVQTDFSNNWPHNDEVAALVKRQLREQGIDNLEELQVHYVARPGPPRLFLGMRSPHGGYLRVVARTEVTRGPDRTRAGTFMTLFFIMVVAVILYITRRVSRQLGRFSLAAEELGRGQAAEPLPERVGPGELRRASAAFNRMQDKVLNLLDERVDMLAGVSHDLRTLCTRLGLRLEYITDTGQQDKAQRDIQLMTDILDQALTFARDEHSDETFAPVDISSLLASLCHALQDQDLPVEFKGPDHLVVEGQRLALTRLFHNLIDNAVKYGGAATVVLSDKGVQVRDPGTGFTKAQQAAALAPYQRLQTARSQDLPGTGLGLAIADNVCRRHEWDLVFTQTDEGFQAEVLFS